MQLKNTSASQHTHQSENDKHLIPNSQIAKSGILERITYTQWHIFDALRKRTKNINVINLASLLAVFPRMGIYAYEITQAELAEKMAELFGMDSVPARNTISKWEAELAKMKLIDAPRHVDWKNKKTKVRLITREFWEMARRGLDKLSYSCPHVTFCGGKSERVEQDIPKDPEVSEINVTEIRARETNDKKSGQSRAKSCKKKYSRPPKSKTGVPKKLNKFENSICFWLFQNRNLASYREGILIFARFLDLPPSDDYRGQLQRAWLQCRDTERPGLVSELIRNMRRMLPDAPEGEMPHVKPPLQSVSADSICRQNEDPEITMLRTALLFGGPYAGQYPEIVREFRSATPDRQDFILENLQDGKIR